MKMHKIFRNKFRAAFSTLSDSAGPTSPASPKPKPKPQHTAAKPKPNPTPPRKAARSVAYKIEPKHKSPPTPSSPK